MNIQIPIDQGETGIYTLLIELKHGSSKFRIGKLGVYDFPKGSYTYTGSALGRGSTDLKRRLLRHISKNKRYHWHIDYFLAKESKIRYIVFFETHKRKECAAVKKLTSFGGKAIIKGFGAPDCTAGCGSHLLFFKQSIKNVLEKVKKAYESLGVRTTTFEITNE